MTTSGRISKAKRGAALVILFSVAMGFAVSGVTAQESAEISSGDVTLANAGDTGDSSIVTDATEDVLSADLVVSVNTSVGEITGAQETQSGQSVDYGGGIDVAPDGSNATINYTDMGGTSPPFKIAELEFQANTGDVDSTPIALSDVRVFDANGDGLSVTEDEGTLSTVDRPNFEIKDLDITPNAVERESSTDVSAVVDNTGDASGTQDIVLNIEGQPSPVDTVPNVNLSDGENYTVEFNNIDTSGFDLGDLDVTVSSDNDSESAGLTVFADRNLVDGDISDTRLRPIANGGDVNITITYVGGSGNVTDDLVLVENVTAGKFDKVQSIINDSNDDRVDSSVGNAGFIDATDPNRDEYFIDLPNFGDGTQFQFTATLRYFMRFDGPTSPPVGPGEQATRDIRLQSIFNEPLVNSFDEPPTNTGELDETLYEDLDGDGDGKSVSQTVSTFGAIIRGNTEITGDQARALNWNTDSPETEVTPADMVSLFGEQIRAD